jgi:hypothetical protein
LPPGEQVERLERDRALLGAALLEARAEVGLEQVRRPGALHTAERLDERSLSRHRLNIAADGHRRDPQRRRQLLIAARALAIDFLRDPKATVRQL